jgi:hypothetical protein
VEEPGVEPRVPLPQPRGVGGGPVVDHPARPRLYVAVAPKRLVRVARSPWGG